MKRTMMVFALALGLALAGCGDDNDGGQVNGKPAKEYFAQFHHKPTVVQGGEQLYRVNWGSSIRTVGDKEYRTDFRLFLNESGAYILEYLELERTIGAIAWDRVVDSTQTGSWRIEGTRLIVGDMFDLSGLNSNGEEVLDGKILRNLNRPGMAGTSITLEKGNTTRAYRE